MNYEKLFELATPFLEKNDFGTAHTKRVLEIARKNFPVAPNLQELTFSSIILHDIGGSSIKDQYEKGPRIATSILTQMGCGERFIQEVCEIIRTHHDHPDNPPLPFRILYDSDKLVMFSPEEFPYYEKTHNFDWNRMVDLIYSEQGKSLAMKMLRQRRSEKRKAAK